jgi:hypothetical protein
VIAISARFRCRQGRRPGSHRARRGARARQAVQAHRNGCGGRRSRRIAARLPHADRVAGSTRSRITLRGALFAFGALLVGINVLSALSDIHSERTAVEHDALRDFSNLTGLLAEQTARSLESVDQLLDAVLSDIKATGIGDPVVREAGWRDRISGMPQVRALLILGPDGRVLVSTDRRITGGLDLADRPYFAKHRDGGAGGRFERPFPGSRLGRGEFALSERIADNQAALRASLPP